MQKHLLPSFFIVMLFTAHGHAQETDDYRSGLMFYMEDAYPIQAIDTSFSVPAIDSLAEWITDTLEARSLYMYGDYLSRSFGVDWYLIEQADSAYIFYPLRYDVAFDHLEFNHDSMHYPDVNGDGVPEVYIHYESYLGHTGWENSIHERWGGLMIIDLANKRKLLEMDSYYTMEQWWTVFAEDTTGTLRYEDREQLDSGGHYECDYFKVQVLKGGLRVQYRLADCINADYDFDPTKEHNQADIPVYEYVWTATGFVLKK